MNYGETFGLLCCILIGLIVVLPCAAYMMVKMGTIGFYRAKEFVTRNTRGKDNG